MKILIVQGLQEYFFWIKDQQPCIFLTVLLKYNLHILLLYNSVIFNKFTELYNNHNNPVLEHLYHPNEISQPQTTTDLFFVSIYAFSALFI